MAELDRDRAFDRPRSGLPVGRGHRRVVSLLDVGSADVRLGLVEQVRVQQRPVGVALDPIDAGPVQPERVVVERPGVRSGHGQAQPVHADAVGHEERCADRQQLGRRGVGRLQPAQGVEKHDQQGEVVGVGQRAGVQVEGQTHHAAAISLAGQCQRNLAVRRA